MRTGCLTMAGLATSHYPALKWYKLNSIEFKLKHHGQNHWYELSEIKLN